MLGLQKYTFIKVLAAQSPARLRAPATYPVGLAVNSSGSLVSSDYTAAKIYVHSGVTSTVSSSFAAPTATIGLTIDSSENLWSGNEGDSIWQHSGISSTITTSFGAGGSSCRGLTLDGSGNLVTTDYGADKIYIYSGLTSTVTSSFNATADGPWDITTDTVGAGC